MRSYLAFSKTRKYVGCLQRIWKDRPFFTLRSFETWTSCQYVYKSSKILKFHTIITPKYITHSDDFLNRFFRNFYSTKNDIIVRKWKLTIKQVDIDLFSSLASFRAHSHFTVQLGKGTIRLTFLTTTHAHLRPLKLYLSNYSKTLFSRRILRKDSLYHWYPYVGSSLFYYSLPTISYHSVTAFWYKSQLSLYLYFLSIFISHLSEKL